MRTITILTWTFGVAAAVAVQAQPGAMPITVLQQDFAVRQAAAAEPMGPGPLGPQPQPMFAPALPPQGGPVPAIAPGAAIVPPPTQGPATMPWTVPWTWQVLPDGLMFKNYLASNEEGRLGTQLYHSQDLGWTWDASVGAHVGIIRYGTQDPAWPEGWQLDADGVVLARLDSSRSMVSNDFRIGFPITRREGPWEFKFGYYHLSSHLGDLYLESHPGLQRINYKREQLVLGVAYRPIQDLRFYSEAAWAFVEDGGARPWEFQFGIDYSPAQPNWFYGAPFAAINTKLTQDTNYSGNFTVEAGWQWRGQNSRTLRTGLQYFNGMSFQRQFYDRFESFVGAGAWYDF